jgi:hypothetical protein
MMSRLSWNFIEVPGGRLWVVDWRVLVVARLLGACHDLDKTGLGGQGSGWRQRVSRAVGLESAVSSFFASSSSCCRLVSAVLRQRFWRRCSVFEVRATFQCGRGRGERVEEVDRLGVCCAGGGWSARGYRVGSRTNRGRSYASEVDWDQSISSRTTARASWFSLSVEVVRRSLLWPFADSCGISNRFVVEPWYEWPRRDHRYHRCFPEPHNGVGSQVV